MQNHIIVTAKRDGFRRAGQAWAGSTVIDLLDFSEDQIKALEHDHMFTLSAVPEGVTLEDLREQGMTIQLKPAQEEVDPEKVDPDVTGNSPDNANANDQNPLHEVDPLIKTLAEVISHLDPENPEHYGTSGKPHVKALEKASGINLTAGQRDEAFGVFSGK